ncbi:MAG: hypothetical protein KBA17_12250 [Aliarcobacter sp.]|nr:hypothetical protein [Aliarcobacter sp.]
MKFSNYTGLSRFEVLQAITKITNEDLKLYKEDIKNLLKENYPKEDLENYNKLSNNEKDLFILELLYKEMNINEDKTIDKIFFEDGREIYNRYEYHGLDIIEKILKIDLNEDNIIENITNLKNELYNIEPYNENDKLDKRKFRGLLQNDLTKINSYSHGLYFVIASINYEIFNKLFDRCNSRDRQRDLKKILNEIDEFKTIYPKEIKNIKEVISNIKSKIGLFIIFDSIEKPQRYKIKKISDTKNTIKLFDLTNNIYFKE